MAVAGLHHMRQQRPDCTGCCDKLRLCRTRRVPGSAQLCLARHAGDDVASLGVCQRPSAATALIIDGKHLAPGRRRVEGGELRPRGAPRSARDTQLHGGPARALAAAARASAPAGVAERSRWMGPLDPAPPAPARRGGRRSRTRAPSTAPPPLALAVVLLLAAAAHLPLRPALAAAPRWVVMVYMIADNNLECFGILDLIVSAVPHPFAYAT